MNDAVILNLTNDVIEQTITIRKNLGVKLPDAIIAATALVYDLTLISLNITDFKSIPGLKVIDIHNM